MVGSALLVVTKEGRGLLFLALLTVSDEFRPCRTRCKVLGGAYPGGRVGCVHVNSLGNKIEHADRAPGERAMAQLVNGGMP